MRAAEKITRYPAKSLGELEAFGVVSLGRGKVISKRDLAAAPGTYPVYSSAKENDGKFGEYGEFMFDEELITWSVDGGGRLFHRRKHRFSVTNVGGTLRVNQPDELDCRFLFFMLSYLHSIVVFDWVQKAHPSVIRKVYDTVPLPPLEEQRRIVAVLDEAFAAIATAAANAEKNLANTRELARVTLLAKTQERSTRRRRLEEVSIVDWGNTDLTKSAYVESGPALAVSAAGCDGRIGHAEHQAGVPVLSAIGARCGRMFFPEEPFTAIKNTITITPRDGEADGKFLFHLLSSVDLPQRGAAQPFIAKGDINKFEVPFPSLEDQHLLVAEMDAMFELCDALAATSAARVQSLSELRQSLLHRAFTGELTAGMPEAIAA